MLGQSPVTIFFHYVLLITQWSMSFRQAAQLLILRIPSLAPWWSHNQGANALPQMATRPAALAAGRLHPKHTVSALSEIVAQLLAPAGVAQAIKSLVFDLADALSGEAELLPHFFQRMSAAIPQAEPQPQNTCLAWSESTQHAFERLAQQLLVGDIGRRERFLVLDEIAELGITIVAYGAGQ